MPGTLERRALPRLVLCCILGSVLAAPGIASAQSQLNLVIGYPPGAIYDVYGRLVARHIGRHLPGNPTVVAQNMPGAGSLRTANYLYNVAPKDGSIIGLFARGRHDDGLLRLWRGIIRGDGSCCCRSRSGRACRR